MLLVLVLAGGFPATPQVISDLLVFLSVYANTSESSKLQVVQGCKVIYDSSSDFEETLSSKIERGFAAEEGSIANDFGYSLLLAHRAGSGRILLFASGGSPQNFIKCAFTARKWGIAVDCVTPASGFVSEMAGVLRGRCFSLEAGGSLFGFLLGLLGLDFGDYVEDSGTRVCSCHGNEIKVGFLCPICLGLYCKFVPLCRHCKTKFVF
ncbi:transcription initiation factor TFIIH subunit 3 [Nematocida homosporus]|uniref:transcription initiation factor TFIIH subunit 3 n=1 Tax=Nematocida homosporus TaxID=1912981 RepID=UPI00222010CD|nr:transcription initiation factor TFIIH subunit 3 [Nematocida homosporus]KAI5186105.1 transcription initiation factor TFIIH subunit 3 [Nematocida homosporus]